MYMYLDSFPAILLSVLITVKVDLFANLSVGPHKITEGQVKVAIHDLHLMNVYFKADPCL